MKELKVGVIGLGMGRQHVKRFHNHPNATVTAICDPDAARLGEIGDLHGIQHRFTRAEAMLEGGGFDIVAIATPNAFHKPLTLAALASGAHVFCEKPMALHADEAREMLDAAQTAQRRIMINFSYRFTPQSWALKQTVDGGALGDIYFARTIWHRRRGMPKFGGWFGQRALSGGGPLIDLGVHRLDLALWLMRYPRPVWVMGSTYDRIAAPLAAATGKQFDVEDLAVGMVKFANGATLEIEAGWAANIAEDELMETRLLGSRAGLLQHNLHGKYDFEAWLFETRPGGHFDARLALPEPPPPTPMGHFVEAILHDRPHEASGEEGLVVMQLLDAIYASAARGEPIRIQEEG